MLDFQLKHRGVLRAAEKTLEYIVSRPVIVAELEELCGVRENRVGLASEDLDVVAEVDQRLGQMAGVHALAPHVGLAPVGEEGDPEGGVAGHGPTSLSGG